MQEFSLIARHFARPARDAVLGVGDDCALLASTPGQHMAVTTDTLVEGVHFFSGTSARALGHKALAVNLSDLAAMSAWPRWATLALTLPKVDDAWLSEFASGLFALAAAYDVELVGGDTTRGPLAFTLTLMGEVPVGAALRRDSAQVGDDIWVSGEFGGPHLAVAERYGKLKLETAGASSAAILAAHTKLDWPTPRVALGIALRGVAHAAIDVSDGLLQDLGHIAARSAVAMRLELDRLPQHPVAHDLAAAGHADAVWQAVVAGGDEYELAFTAPASERANIAATSERTGVSCTRVGAVVAPQVGGRVDIFDAAGREVKIARTGFDHFAQREDANP